MSTIDRIGIQRIAVERTTVISGDPFDTVLAKLEAAVGHPDMAAFGRDVVAADTPADLIIPMQLDRRKAILEGFYLSSIARLKPGVSIGEANADIARLLPIWVRSWASDPGGPPGDGVSALKSGRLAQLVRAPALQAGGRRFESCTAHHLSAGWSLCGSV